MLRSSATDVPIAAAVPSRTFDSGTGSGADHSGWCWKIHRVRAMGPMERVARVQRMGVVLLDSNSPAVPGLSRVIWPSARRAAALGSGGRSKILSQSRADLAGSAAPEAAARIAAAGERLLAGQFNHFGADTTTLERPLRLPSRSGHGCGVAAPPRATCRLSIVQRRRSAQRLGADQTPAHHPTPGGLRVTNNANFLECAVGDLRAWLHAGPSGVGIGWSSGFEAGLRAVSLALSIDALRGRHGVKLPLELLIQSVQDHVTWIQRYPSRYSSGNNHELGELVAAGCVRGRRSRSARPGATVVEAARGLLRQTVSLGWRAL